MHFVSKSCNGEKCSVCFKPSTHKLSEEIMWDEPCMICGKDTPTASDECKASYHTFGGPTAQRHPLTAYVCCFHYSMIVGKWSGCELTDNQRAMLAYIKTYTDPDSGYDNPRMIKCVNCYEDLELESLNSKGNRAFISCPTCKQASVVDVDKVEFRKSIKNEQA